jgi:hypothetical protein
MHRARAVPGWQYYQSGRYRSFQFLCFQSMMSSPGTHAVTQSLVSPGKNHPGQLGGPVSVFNGSFGPRAGLYSHSEVQSSCGAPSEQFVVHLNKNCGLY